MNIRQAKFKFPLVDILTHYKHVVYEHGPTDHTCCCPFHRERTPSFHIYTKKREYHCFGCGVHGDVITFVQKVEQLETISEALKFLSDLEASRQDPGGSSKSKSYDELIKEIQHLQTQLEQAKPLPTRTTRSTVVTQDEDIAEWEFFN